MHFPNVSLCEISLTVILFQSSFRFRTKLAYMLFGFAILLAIIAFAVHKFVVTNEIAIYAMSTGIAMIPESLIAVLTITFVTGMTQMRKLKVPTRNLSALEALGGITNICSDKTGTLTQGQMTVKKAWIPDIGIYTISNSDNPANPTQGNISVGPAKSKTEMDAEKTDREERFDRERSAAALTFKVPSNKADKDQQCHEPQERQSFDGDDNPEMVPELEYFLNSTALCNVATVRLDEQEGKWQTAGDPTEVALQVFAHRIDKGKKLLEQEVGWNQITEYPFDSTVKLVLGGGGGGSA
ncbi:metal cation-transporting ATPase [Mytilinidion resinicola]|uniref:Metal cation-transporting ATPase n=1 Tax=Mytilinidion resinicola TaxID=574789 RepID=A0A6A6YUU6_9PEZI|nr:metal cation-transporting ATPase [Mytilinidion resinicola]KAF2812153.1 metal cation-transporting ATPase [Mytilinidion resinicola]